MFTECAWPLSVEDATVEELSFTTGAVVPSSPSPQPDSMDAMVVTTRTASNFCTVNFIYFPPDKILNIRHYIVCVHVPLSIPESLIYFNKIMRIIFIAFDLFNEH
jgi:hypothetical protein